MPAVLAYLETHDPDAAALACRRYGCFDRFGLDEQVYGLIATSGADQAPRVRYASCALWVFMSSVQPAPPNRLLQALLRHCKAFHVRAEAVAFPVGHVVYVAGQTMSHIYFPRSGVLSISVQLENGETAESLSVGNEGLVGLAVWLGQKKSVDQVIQQAPGELRRLSVHTFCDMIEDSRGASRLLKHFAAYKLQAAYRAVVCNAHHSVKERVCRWILATADRARSSQMQLSHALLANMLGVQRSTVSEVASALKREGVLDYRRTAISILNRSGLEQRTCECYRAMNDLYSQLVVPLL